MPSRAWCDSRTNWRFVPTVCIRLVRTIGTIKISSKALCKKATRRADLVLPFTSRGMQSRCRRLFLGLVSGIEGILTKGEKMGRRREGEKRRRGPLPRPYEPCLMSVGQIPCGHCGSNNFQSVASTVTEKERGMKGKKEREKKKKHQDEHSTAHSTGRLLPSTP